MPSVPTRSPSDPFALLLAYLRHQWRVLALTLAVNVLGNALELLAPAVLRYAIDAIARASATALSLYALAIVGTAVAGAACRYTARSQSTNLSRVVEYEMRRDLFDHLQRLDAAYYQRTRTGDLMARATNDLGAVRSLVGPGFYNLANTAVMATTTLLLMWRIDHLLALYCAVMLPALSGTYVLFKRRIERRFRAVQEQFSALSAAAQDNISGIRVIKAYAQEEAEIAAFRAENREYVRRSLRLALTTGMLWPLMSVVSGMATVLLLYLGGRDVIGGRITVGQFVQFNAYLAMLSWPMIALGWVTNLVQQGKASLIRIAEVLAERPAVAQPERPRKLAWLGNGARPHSAPPLRASLELRGVHFAYGERGVLRGIDLAIPAGSMLGIVGATGAGKSTLAHLLARLFDPTRGAVLLDGIDLRELALEDVRGAVALVPQETFLFSEPLEANIGFGLGWPPGDPRVREAAVAAGLESDLKDLPEGLATMVGERGVTLSGGQKQRTALARALVRDPVVLVLDDVLSSVDTATADAVLRRLRTLRDGKTTIVIAHRLSTVQHADQIVVLAEGRLAERGTHRHLLGLGGLYARTYRQQLLREELAEDDG